MKKVISLLCIACMFLMTACQSGTEKTTSNSDAETASSQSSAKRTNAIAGVGACTLLSEETLKAVLPSTKGYMMNEDNDDEGRRIMCNLAAKDGSGLIVWSINYNKKGWKSNKKRFAENTAFKPLKVAGADGAYRHTIQGRVEIWKGKYAITLTPPMSTVITSSSQKEANAIRVAEELLKNLK